MAPLPGRVSGVLFLGCLLKAGILTEPANAQSHPSLEAARCLRDAGEYSAAIDTLEILTYSVHTELVWLEFQKRLAQIDSIIRSVGEAYEHVIIGGDFNTESGHYVQIVDELFEGAGFTRATKDVGPTAKADPFGLISLRFDHIFTKGMTVVDRGKIEGMEASDHLPIWADLKLE